ncbi:hypothetical protein B0H66DRAFT_548130 [Apodospora peruviana]|uniref:Uncharacterized protein n=1 Tax=Apodospora peruviana TaxID=516989 RepID=A0AAE0MBA2_9PEZI|nr:hypothetical protein B0H66DRAFT_548130 [Apodospora peruviana]
MKVSCALYFLSSISAFSSSSWFSAAGSFSQGLTTGCISVTGTAGMGLGNWLNGFHREAGSGLKVVLGFGFFQAAGFQGGRGGLGVLFQSAAPQEVDYVCDDVHRRGYCGRCLLSNLVVCSVYPLYWLGIVSSVSLGSCM